MSLRPLLPAATCVLVTACAGAGPSGPPALAYGVPAQTEVTYVQGDTTMVEISLMGQTMELSQEGVADYAVTFGPAADGVSVRMTLAALSATINQPMGAPLRLDEGDVTGELAFSMDRRGDVTISALPQVADAASQMVSGLALAHTFFPGLPGAAPPVGGGWVDTVSYEGPDGPGMSSEKTILEYTVVGDSLLDGRTLLNITFLGTTERTTDIEAGGMAVNQSSTLDVQGHVLWDRQARLMYESVRTATGAGEVRVPISPAPLPIELSMRRHTRLKGM